MRFVVLASGSAGNASYVEADGFGLLIDIGLGPRQLEARLLKMGLDWQRIQAILLTHTHSDHWNERSLARLAERGIPLYCHPQHHRLLRASSPAFVRLGEQHLLRDYEPGRLLSLSARLACWPFAVRHDSGLTCGFRLEGPPDLFGQPLTLGYAADLGSWDERVAKYLSDVDVLALEFNHDVVLQKASSRSPRTIARNLGHAGHLSNEQAADLIRHTLQQSGPERLQHIIQLHLSRECNRPALAVGALRELITQDSHRIEVHTARQDEPGPDLTIGFAEQKWSALHGQRRRRRSRPSGTPQFFQPLFPGWDEESA